MNRKSRRLLVGLSVAVAMFGLAGCSGASEPEESPPTSDQAASQEPDLSGIPDVVAEVNGTQLTGDGFVELYEAQFQQMQAQSQTTGEQVDQQALRKQTVEVMVDTELLTQEADARQIQASQADLDAALEEIAVANQMESTQDVLAALAEQGVTEDEIYSQLETQVRLDRLMAEETDDSEPTEQELRELYDQVAAQQEQSGEAGTELPPFEEVKPQLVEQVVSSKQSEAYGILVSTLRENADVTVILK